MANVLITGGAGFIGANFVYYWVQHHPEDRVIVLDALTYAGNAASLRPLNDKIIFVHGNINDGELVERLLQQYQIDSIVHFAAESHVDRSIAGPDIFLNTNILGTHELLKAARKAWEKNNYQDVRFHHVSTDEVYGTLNATDPAFTETTAYAPNSPYAASKAGSDHIVRAYHHTYGMPVTISNCSNNYGPYQFPEKLIPLLITRALHGEALPIYGDGKNIRDWLYVEDHCRGIELILLKGKVGEVYNIGGNNEQNNLTIIELITQLMDAEFAANPELKKQFPTCPAASGNKTKQLVQFVADRPGHDRRYAINASKIINELGYQPLQNFQQALQQTLRWYLQNQSWWQALLEKRAVVSN